MIEKIMEEMDGRFWDELFTRRSELAERLENSLKSLREKVEINGKECRYIYSSFLWTDLLEGRYRAVLQAVGEDYILDDAVVLFLAGRRRSEDLSVYGRIHPCKMLCL